MTSTAGKRVNLALQGGGAHGAFTWGVLDKLLEDDRLFIQSICGASAGAMNAVVAAQGLYDGGPDGARQALERFWRRVSDLARLSPLQRAPWEVAGGGWSLDSNPTYIVYDLLSRVSSPYQANPIGYNPLRGVLEDSVNFETLRHFRDCFGLFVCATNVETGRVRVFDREELSVDVLLASACLPSLFHAVEVQGSYYWDGGYMGNPALFPFAKHNAVNDIVIVQINPILRAGVPKGAREILNRVNEISFNSSLLRELRAIHDKNELIACGDLNPNRHQPVRVHMIQSRKRMRQLDASSKLNAEWAFLQYLFGIGRDAAAAWLDQNYDDIGVRETLDLGALFADIGGPTSGGGRSPSLSH